MNAKIKMLLQSIQDYNVYRQTDRQMPLKALPCGQISKHETFLLRCILDSEIVFN